MVILFTWGLHRNNVDRVLALANQKPNEVEGGL
jgi:hypothetical protein